MRVGFRSVTNQLRDVGDELKRVRAQLRTYGSAYEGLRGQLAELQAQALYHEDLAISGTTLLLQQGKTFMDAVSSHQPLASTGQPAVTQDHMTATRM